MTISLSIDSRTVNLSSSRLERIMTQKKEQATVLGLWDKIKDYFRSEKKQDVINKIYDLTHQDTDLTLDSVLEKSISIFCKIKGMSDPASKDVFKLVCDRSEGSIKFLAGETVLYNQSRTSLPAERDQNILNGILAADPELINDLLNESTDFIADLNLHKMNADKDLKNKFLSNINKRLPERDLLGEIFDHSNNKEIKELLQPALIFSENKQLFKDINRGTFDLDGVKLFSYDGVEKKEKEVRLNSFLHKLTSMQRVALDVVGSQIAPIEIIRTLFENNSSLSFVAGPHHEFECFLDKDSGELKAKVTIQQALTQDRFNTLLGSDAYSKAKDHAFWCEGLHLETLFSIAPKGDITCTDFHFSSKTPLDSIIKQDNEQLFGWLNEFRRSKHTALTLDAEGIRRLNKAALSDELLAYSSKKKEQMQAILAGDFGQRLRAIMDFAAFQTGRNCRSKETYSVMKCLEVIEDLIILLDEELNGANLTADRAKELLNCNIKIESMSDMTQQEGQALIKIGITSDMLKDEEITPSA